MARFVTPQGPGVFISDATLANPPQEYLDNMSAVYIDSAGNRWVSNGSVLGPLANFGFNRNQGLALYGDSITAQNNYVDSNFVPTKSQNIGYAIWAVALSGNVCDIVRNAAIAGNNTTQMLARIDADLLRYKSEFAACCIMGGTNDPNTDPNIVLPNLATMYQKLVDSGVYVFALTILPRPAASTLQQANINRVNQWISNYWRNSQYGECFDAFSCIVSPSSTTQAVVSNALPDNTHPSNVGAALIGAPLATRLSAFFQTEKPLLNSASNLYSLNSQNLNIMPGGLMLSGGGQVYGAFVGSTCANGFVLSGNVNAGVGSLVARSDGFGNDQVINVTATAANQQFVFDVPAPTLNTNFVAGDVLQWSCEITIESGFTGFSEIFGIANLGGTSMVDPNWLEQGATSFQLPAGEKVLAMFTQPFVVPSDLTTISFSVRGRFAAAGSAVVRIGRFALTKVIAV